VLTAALKLADIAARSLFVLLALFLLSARETGQFGLFLVLVGFFGFAAGYERHPDLQRVLVQLDSSRGDQLVVSTLRLYFAHYIVTVPALLILLVWWVDLPYALVAACCAITIGEHFTNESYRVAVIVPRYRALMAIGLVKNVLLLACMAVLLLPGRPQIDLAALLWLWGVLSLLSLAALGFAFRRFVRGRAGPLMPFVKQWKASRTHFLIGLVAILSLQADRLLAGSFLTLEAAGVYFRHVFLASVGYQALGVLSFNRILPQVYTVMRRGDRHSARNILNRERRRVVPLCIAIASACWVVKLPGLAHWDVAQQVIPLYLSVLVLAYMVRSLADYNSLVLNGAYRESSVLRAQLLAVVISAAVGLLAAPRLGVPGILAATLTGSVIYALTSGWLSHRILSATPP